jgi:hypothetical protein
MNNNFTGVGMVPTISPIADSELNEIRTKLGNRLVAALKLNDCRLMKRLRALGNPSSEYFAWAKVIVTTDPEYFERQTDLGLAPDLAVDIYAEMSVLPDWRKEVIRAKSEFRVRHKLVVMNTVVIESKLKDKSIRPVKKAFELTTNDYRLLTRLDKAAKMMGKIEAAFKG